MKQEELFILIVEDSRTYRELLRRQLARRLNFEIITATSLAEARQRIAEHGEQIFFAILDLNLPDAPNGEIVDEVLGHGISSVVVTATFDEKVREQIIVKNIVDYVVKEGIQDLEYIAKLIDRTWRNQQIMVMVVDDSPTYRHVLRNLLTPHKYQIVEAGNGREALDLLKSNADIRLILTDNQMPEMDGFELVGKVRKQYSKEDVSIIGLSAASGGMLSARFLKRGANDFLGKPFSKEEFFCRVNQNIEMIEMIHEVRESANRDYLTNLYNRRYFFGLGDKYFENVKRNQLSMTVAMIDIDFFKVVNDTYGHEAGDLVICKIAELLNTGMRKTDIVSRFGGEEFCVLCVNCKSDGVRQVFERLRRAVEDAVVEYEGQQIKVTVSIGVQCRRLITLSDTVREADELLYLAKEQGRNRVVLGGEDEVDETVPTATPTAAEGK